MHWHAVEGEYKNIRLVWDVTANVLDDVFQNVWGDREVVEVANITDLTVPVSLCRTALRLCTSALTALTVAGPQVTLLVIGIAGFGRRMSWSEDQIAPPGHSMTFKVRARSCGTTNILIALRPHCRTRCMRARITCT